MAKQECWQLKTNKALESLTTKTHVSCIVTLKLQRLNQRYYLNSSAWFVLLRKLLKWLMEPRFQIGLTSVLPTVKYLLYSQLSRLVLLSSSKSLFHFSSYVWVYPFHCQLVKTARFERTDLETWYLFYTICWA